MEPCHDHPVNRNRRDRRCLAFRIPCPHRRQLRLDKRLVLGFRERTLVHHQKWRQVHPGDPIREGREGSGLQGDEGRCARDTADDLAFRIPSSRIQRQKVCDQRERQDAADVLRSQRSLWRAYLQHRQRHPLVRGYRQRCENGGQCDGDMRVPRHIPCQSQCLELWRHNPD